MSGMQVSSASRLATSFLYKFHERLSGALVTAIIATVILLSFLSFLCTILLYSHYGTVG